MKQVLLVNLDHGKQTVSGHVPVALGLLKLGTYYRNMGYEVHMTSCAYLKKEYNPDIICFSPLFLFNVKRDLGYMISFRRKYPKALIRVGGVMVTLKPDMFKKYLGEGVGIEYVKGLQGFDNLRPAYDLLNMKVSYGFTSRGCPRRCEWCVVPKTEDKLRQIDYWAESIHPDHNLYLAMDNNFLACGYDWVEGVIKEFADRKMKVDFNQGLDCRIFAKDERFLDLFHRYKHVFYLLRFSWDSKAQDKYVVKTLEMLKDKKVKCSSNTLWYMLYGSSDDPEAIWNRMRTITSYDNRIKPMCFRNLETGVYEGGWVRGFRAYINGISKGTNYITQGNFKDGLYGKTGKDFLECIRIGKNLHKMESRGFKKEDISTLINGGM